MTKLLAILFTLAFVVSFIWAWTVGGADGSREVTIIVGALLAVLLIVTRVRTGQWLSDSSGGH